MPNYLKIPKYYLKNTLWLCFITAFSTSITSSIALEPEIVPVVAKMPNLNEITAAAKLIKNGMSAEESTESLQIANSWRQQKMLIDINKLKLQELQQELNNAKIQKELTKLRLENKALLEHEQQQRKAPQKPLKDILLTSIYADKKGILKATLITKQGKITVRRGYQISDLIVSEIGTQHIVLKNQDSEYALYVN